MAKILIIANASNRARVFMPIVDTLIDSGVKVSAMSLDKILHGGASPVLQKSRIPFIELNNPRDKCLFEMPKPMRFETLKKLRKPIREILGALSPDVILLGAASYVEGVIIEEARRRKVRTVLMQDGLRLYEKTNPVRSLKNRITEKGRALANEWAISLYSAPYFFTPFETNRVDGIFLFGSGILEEMAGRGIRREKLIITGNPLYDSAAPIPSNEADEIRAFLGISKNDRIVLFGMQCFQKHNLMRLDDETKLVRAIVEIFREIPHVDLVIKLHPDNDYEHYRKQFFIWDPPSNIHLLKDEYTPQELLGISHLFMTVYSTMALEALVYKVPVVTLGFTPIKYKLKLEPAAISVSTPAELRKILLEWDENLFAKIISERGIILDRECANLGFASEKAAEALLEIAKSGQ